MKLTIKRILQPLLGVETYLTLFSLFKIATLRWDKTEGQFCVFESLLPDKGYVIDVGANIGVMSTLLARKAERRIIYAYEPAALNFSVLSRITSYFRLKNVRLYPWAIGSEDGEVGMLMPMAGSVVLHGLSHVVDNDSPIGQGYRFQVPCRRLDDRADFFAAGVKVIGIKIDVEGHEISVLEGARRLLLTHHPLVYCEVSNENRSRCFKLVRQLGYEIKVAQNGRLIPFEGEQHRNYGNFFFVPEAST